MIDSDTIIRMAREAGFPILGPERTKAAESFALLVAARVLASTYPEMFDIVSEAAKAKEREQCAILLETYGLDLCPGDKDVQRYRERTKPAREYYAAAIRARN